MPLSPARKEGISNFEFLSQPCLSRFFTTFLFFPFCAPFAFCLANERGDRGRRDYNIAHFFSFFPFYSDMREASQFRPFFLFYFWEHWQWHSAPPLFVYVTYGRNIFSREQNCLWDATLEKTYIVRHLRLNKYQKPVFMSLFFSTLAPSLCRRRTREGGPHTSGSNCWQ